MTCNHVRPDREDVFRRLYNASGSQFMRPNERHAMVAAQTHSVLDLWPGESRAARDREVARRAWQEGFSASERCWEETYDLTTPDEGRTDPRKPYGEGGPT